jgi:hypothetical protein
MPRPVIASLLLLSFASALPAQPLGNWGTIKQLFAGEEVRITLDDGRKLQGKFQSSGDDNLVITASRSDETMSRIQVARVASRGRNHRLRNTLIGIGAGGAAGLILGVASNHCAAGTNCLFHNLGIELFTPMGALAGAIVGAVIPTGGWHDIYRAR